MRDPSFVSVIMPVRNEARYIRDTLSELLSQDYPSDLFEIIVADGESTDSTREIVEEITSEHPQVMLFSNPGRLPSSGRNVGFRHGRGELFLVIDGHCRIGHTQLLKNVVDCFERSGADCLGRPQPLVVPDEAITERAIVLARSSWLGHSVNSFIYSDSEGFVSPRSVGCAYKREVLDKVGLLDESFDACEDVEFNYRVETAGFKCFFSPKIAVQYFPRKNLRSLSKQLLRYSVGRVRLMRKHPATAGTDIYLPSVFLGGLVLGPLTIFISQYLFWFYLACVAVYLITVGVESVRLGGREGLGFVAKIAAAFVTIHVTLGAGVMWGIVRERKSRAHRA